MAVRLHLHSRTAPLTFPIGVCFIALAFRRKAIQISHIDTELDRRDMEKKDRFGSQSLFPWQHQCWHQGGKKTGVRHLFECTLLRRGGEKNNKTACGYWFKEVAIRLKLSWVSVATLTVGSVPSVEQTGLWVLMHTYLCVFARGKALSVY